MITLIGNSLAVEGLEFKYLGASSHCEKCRFKNTCIDTLEEGRIYIIKEVKDTQQPCPIHAGGKVRVVDVELADIDVLIDPKQSFEGSSVLFNPITCDSKCYMRDLCLPEGLYKDDRCRIIENKGKPEHECPRGLKLQLVRLRRG